LDGSLIEAVVAFTLPNITKDYTIEVVIAVIKGNIDGDGDMNIDNAILALQVLSGNDDSITLHRA